MHTAAGRQATNNDDNSSNNNKNTFSSIVQIQNRRQGKWETKENKTLFLYTPCALAGFRFSAEKEWENNKIDEINLTLFQFLTLLFLF